MKKQILTVAVLSALLTAGVAFAGGNLTVKCHNGFFTGAAEAETGVLSFKGIPYARQPVGPLRWKAPQELPAGNNTYSAKEFGVVPLQNINMNDSPELANVPTDENCLNVNIWTADLTTKNKPVMFYIHGGSYGWEAARSDFYDMQYMVKDNPDIVVVTFDYRVNSLGFLDLSKVPDGKIYKSADFKDSPYLGLLDTIAALKWTKKNIAAFGGNPNNITVFGESAGGGMTSALLVAKKTKGLFQHAIVQSGASNLSMTQETFDKLGQTEAIMKATGAKNMDDLMALTKEDILRAWSMEADHRGMEGASKIEDLNNHPMRGGRGIIPADPLAAIKKGAGKDVDLMIGTTADEWRYWIHLQPGNLEEQMASVDFINKLKEEEWRKTAGEENKDLFDAYLKIARTKNDAWDKKFPGFSQRFELVNDMAFRMNSIKMAENHSLAKGKGKTYMYYFAKESDLCDWVGAPHASELPYVFNNPKLGGDPLYGNINVDLAKKICRIWTNFARTGNPNIEGLEFEEYDAANRKTLVIGNDNSLTMVKNPLEAQRLLLDKINLYYSI